jgi:hypothetical protein
VISLLQHFSSCEKAVRIAAVSFLRPLISFAENLSGRSASLSLLTIAAGKTEKAVRVIDYSFDKLSYTVCMEIKSCYTFHHSKNNSWEGYLLPVTYCFCC